MEEPEVLEKIQASKSKVGSKERAPRAKGIYSGFDAPPIPKVAGQDTAFCSAQALIFMPNIWDPWTDGDTTMICSIDDRISDANGGEKQSRWALGNVARAFCNDLFDRKTSTEELGILIYSRLQWAIQQRALPGTHRVRYKQAGEGSPFPFNNIAFTEMSLMTLASLSPVQLVYYLHEQNIPSDWVPWESVELANFAESCGDQYSPNEYMKTISATQKKFHRIFNGDEVYEPECEPVQEIRGALHFGHMFNFMCMAFLRKYFYSQWIFCVDTWVEYATDKTDAEPDLWEKPFPAWTHEIWADTAERIVKKVKS
ncbi:hypothetical protein B484DRAFT_435751 [Ochromonadaceae sp. CCMP2298]|nr:hypothetical protein B484DRAFT_435751 [Ochromonadaceae sp. CCMP2298]